jgi:predicted RND superfamily exporter protein
MSIPNSSLEDYNLGLEDLKKADKLSPQDATILQTLNQIKQEISRLKAGTDTLKGFLSPKNEKINEKAKGSVPSMKKDSEDFNDSVVSTQAKSEDSIDQIVETTSIQKKSVGDNQTMNECYQSLSKSNLESTSTFNQEIGKLGK